MDGPLLNSPRERDSGLIVVVCLLAAALVIAVECLL